MPLENCYNIECKLCKPPNLALLERLSFATKFLTLNEIEKHAIVAIFTLRFGFLEGFLKGFIFL